MQRIIAITNQKGGVGKTTTSINFASGLANAGYRVLLIDLDPQAHATLGLGIVPGTYHLAINDVLVNKQDIREVILKTDIENLFLAPSHIRLERDEQILNSEYFREGRLHKATLNLDYDFIVIDCRPSLGTLTINALYASDFIIVPCEMARYSLEGFADLMDAIDSVKNSGNANQDKSIYLLLTNFDSRNKRTNEWVLAELEDFKDQLFKTKIRKNEALNQANIARKPIFAFQPTSHGAEDYLQVTKEFLNLCHQ